MEARIFPSHRRFSVSKSKAVLIRKEGDGLSVFMEMVHRFVAERTNHSVFWGCPEDHPQMDLSSGQGDLGEMMLTV